MIPITTIATATLAVATTYPESELVPEAERVATNLADVTIETIQNWFD